MRVQQEAWTRISASLVNTGLLNAFYIIEQTRDDELTIANKGGDGFSFWPGWSFEEAVSQLVPAVKKQTR